MIENNERINKDDLVLDENAASKAYEQASTQLNNQDLDQIQFNSQNLHITVNNNATGEIIGMVYCHKSKVLIDNVEILLYFGDLSETPIRKAKTDKTGYFEFNDLPPGYYTLFAKYKECECKFQYIKISYNETVFKQLALNL